MAGSECFVNITVCIVNSLDIIIVSYLNMIMFELKHIAHM